MDHTRLPSNLMLENEQRFRAFFLLKSIDNVSVTFDGGGDSGQIDCIEFYQSGVAVPLTDPIVVWTLGKSVFAEGKGWTQEPPIEASISIRDAVESHVYEALEMTGVDWCINDGGYGSWKWSAVEGLDFSVYQRYVKEELEYNSCRPLGEEDDEQVQVSE